MINLLLMESLVLLKNIRVEVRIFFLRKYRNSSEPFLWGVYLKVSEQNYESTNQDLVEYFQSRNYYIEHSTAPSPSGQNPQGYKVYISSVCDNEDYSKMVGINVSIHHEDEMLIARDSRANYCY
jgi:hypothetical protein